MTAATIAEIKQAVAEHFEIGVDDLVGPSRRRVFSSPRMIGYWLAESMTTLSLSAIGRAFGGRDHSTVDSGIRSVARRKAEVSADLDVITDALTTAPTFRSTRCNTPAGETA